MTEPETLLLDGDVLARSRERVRAGDARLALAMEQLRADADEVLSAGPFSVTFKKSLPPSGDPHDYVSMGTYWWPDHDKPGGVPYVRRDGYVNPETHEYDVSPLKSLARVTQTLALAWYFTQDDRYAARAAELLRTWFLDPATRMNPHLRFAQFIPGICEGRGIGLIDTVALVPVFADVLPLLQASDAWTADDHVDMAGWCGHYLHWLRTDKLGLDERREHNNHGTGCDLQLAAFALVTGDPAFAREIVAEVPTRRIDRHLAADGRQPHELARTRSYSYSIFNLSMLIELARLGGHVSVDLWGHRTPEGASLAAAAEFIAVNVLKPGGWPFEQVTPSEFAPLVRLLRITQQHSGAVDLRTHLDELHRREPDLTRHRLQLTDPATAPATETSDA